MIMKKHLAAVLLLISTVILAAFPVQASTKSKTYKAYKTWISKGAKDSHGDKYNKFCLVNIDADKIPELVATSSNYGISTYYILSYKGNRLVSLTLYGGVSGTGGYRGNSMYLPSKGRLLAISASSGGRGSIQHTVYKLTKNGFSKYRTGSYDGIFAGSETNIQWNGKSVSIQQYNKSFKKAFNMKKGKYFDKLKYVSKAAILKKLS